MRAFWPQKRLPFDSSADFVARVALTIGTQNYLSGADIPKERFSLHQLRCLYNNLKIDVKPEVIADQVLPAKTPGPTPSAVLLTGSVLTAGMLPAFLCGGKGT